MIYFRSDILYIDYYEDNEKRTIRIFPEDISKVLLNNNISIAFNIFKSLINLDLNLISVIYSKNATYHFHNGNFHRLNGPSILNKLDNTNYYFIKGNIYTIDKYYSIVKYFQRKEKLKSLI
jgi:hypothetical protein